MIKVSMPFILQTAGMRRMLKQYSIVVYLGGTYCLNNMGYPLYVFVCTDGMKKHVVGYVVVKNEIKITTSKVLHKWNRSIPIVPKLITGWNWYIFYAGFLCHPIEKIHLQSIVSWKGRGQKHIINENGAINFSPIFSVDYHYAVLPHFMPFNFCKTKVGVFVTFPNHITVYCQLSDMLN